MKKRSLRIVLGVVLLLSVLFLYRHPILLKWMTGSARMIGLPVRASVYTDAEIDKRIKVFHSNVYGDGRKADYYILYLLSPYSFKTKHIISINIRDTCLGVPSVTDKITFDLVFGILFQSRTGTQFSDFRDNVSGYGFDPRMDISARTIRFNLLSKQKPEASSIRIEFLE
jgi:hypothetical protein